ncbi:cache domain-containing sensor histidine kinase [Petrocella sp. FN5]|uniref:cache domain-containing sensor histidine kinase n=1 Tax=Petrocella sp. FN5 TaxID=3032002 RepID=UPI0023DB7F09|nr:sensor histidine kinase [Petrocella sp. FN5]MDF1618228.1 sensor histidine kinase [Petrocella sp. FN5]
MKQTRIPLFYKLFATFILCSTIPLLIISGLMYGLSVNFLNKTIYDQTYTNIEVAHQRINDKIVEYEGIIQGILNNEDIVQAISTENDYEVHENTIYEIIYEALIEQNIKPVVHITNISGSIIFSTTPIPEVYEIELKNKWGIFREINQKTNRTVIYPQKITYLPGRRSIISLGTQIINHEGEHVGYILIDVPREVILEEMKAVHSGLSLHLVLLDDNAYTLLDTQNSNMEGKFQRSSYLDYQKNLEYRSIKEEIAKDSFLVVDFKDEQLGTTTIANVSSNVFQSFNRILGLILLIGAIVSLSISLIISYVLARFISHPIKDLISIMGKVEEGTFSVKANSRSNDEIGDLAKYFNQMLDRLNTYMNKVVEKQQQLRTTEIKMLQAQVNPHFIYNTLDVIKWSAKLGQKSEVVSVVTNLAKILRNSIDCDEEFVSVKRSISFIDSYLAIQKIKYNNAFKVIRNIDHTILECKVPRLIIQPFVENAIVHGLSNHSGNGEISINGFVKAGIIEFQIIDNGIGMTDEEIKKVSDNKSDQHIGIHNVDQRIKLYYGDGYGVHIESQKYKGTKVAITVPCLYEGEVL